MISLVLFMTLIFTIEGERISTHQLSRPTGKAPWFKLHGRFIPHLDFYDKIFNLRPLGKYSTRTFSRATPNRPFGKIGSHDHLASKSFRSNRYGEGSILNRFKEVRNEFVKVEKPAPTSITIVKSPIHVIPAGATAIPQSPPAPALQTQSLKTKTLEQTQDSIRKVLEVKHIMSKNRFKKVANPSPTSVPARVTILPQSSPAPALQKQTLKIKSLEQTKDSIQQAFEAQHIIGKNILKTIFDEVVPVVKPPPTSLPSAKFTPPVTPAGLGTVTPLPILGVITISNTVNKTYEIEDQTRQVDFDLDCVGQISTRGCIQDNFNIFFEEIYNKACLRDQHCSAVSYCSNHFRCTPTTVTMIITLIVIGLISLAILWCCYYCCCKSCKCRTSLPFRPKPQIKQRNNNHNSDADPEEQVMQRERMQPYILAECEAKSSTSRDLRLLHAPSDFQTFHRCCGECRTSSQCSISSE